ncbi:hypothetical protein M501DRAFT_1006501 [Patellaria atrata CBS 101060]|uniref:RING-type domain-containing protein n=1 Tax=Patellaria atrata CBS 101060 TaxID=1346257 RepID=A0A9P4S775_9PEZI|nr:hypothetical protein M501DRAFT_1006501 [Patellaria atrata CBS 101060]
MSRSEHDQFIDDDEEETCPLCVEEFDLSDKNFRPCPCGYQICQFCYNNIKTTMNGLCPACRRKYDDKNIEWKVVSAEEMASYRADQAQQAKKKAAAKQKEAQRREADSLSLKHLAGMRVVQKNLVYVTGLSPTIREDQLLQTLRGDQYFGQYGKIVKIVVSKAKDTSHPQQSVGVYVTFARKEDAESCITAVDGSQNGDRVLRAQYGTTKYCSAYLRGETCNNRNCMFLHEPGEANESFTRQDLSSRNSKPTQQPAQSQNNPSHPPQPQPPPQQAPQSIAAAKRPDSKDGGNATDGGGDGPALPSTANWGNKSNQAHQRRASHATTESAASPTVLTSAPAVSTTEPNKSKAEGKKPVKEQDRQSETVEISSSTPQQVAAKPSIPFRMSSSSMPHLERCCKVIAENYSKKYTYNPDGIKGFTEEDKKIVENFPDLFDIENGPRLYVQRRERAAREKQQAEARAAAQVAAQTADTTGDQEEHPEGGSLQLGGEPEERQDMSAGQSQHAIQPPSQQQLLGLNRNYPLSEDFTNLGPGNRGLTPQQQQQILLQQFKTSNSNANTLLNPQASSQQAQGQSQPYAPGHARQTSRFSFANDSASASANIKPVGNAKLMNQQAAMMPQNTSHSNFISQPQSAGNHFFSSGVQGPPPGLKTTGTPPVSGGGMFGQGHGFATSTIGYGANAAARSSNEEMMRELLRGRGANTSVQDPAKRELMFPSFLSQHPSSTSTPTSTPGLLSFPYGPQPGAYQDSGLQKQKKKGKKHRHANTSSSGGGVVNDLADPSVLQARLHQGGGVSMGGQGIYAGQGQGGFTSMYSGNYGRW